MTQNKSERRFDQEESRQGWAFFEESGAWRRTPQPWGAPADHFPKEMGGWVSVRKPKSWLPPVEALIGEPLLGSGGATLSSAGGGGAGSGTKKGAGHKPQSYSLRTGEYQGIGGGLSGGNEVRGKVTPPVRMGKPVRAPAPLSKGGRVVATTRNDDPNEADLDPQALPPKTRDLVQGVLDKSPSARDFNMNSGYRSGAKGAHGEGRAVDINRVNGQKVLDAVDPSVSADQRETMRKRLEEIRTAAETEKDVEAYIDPLDGFFRPKDPKSKEEGRKANGKEIFEHRHHIHITIRE